MGVFAVEVAGMKIRYWVVLVLVGLFVSDWWIHRPDSRSRELNEVIAAKASAQARSYPYQFEVPGK